MSEETKQGWIRCEPGYAAPKNGQPVLVTQRLEGGRIVRAAVAYERGPGIIGFFRERSDQPGEWLMGVTAVWVWPEPFEDGEVAP